MKLTEIDKLDKRVPNIKHVVVAIKPETAQKYIDEGYIAIETSYGHISVTDKYTLDHHGSLSHLVNPAKRAQRSDLFGKGKELGSKYVVSHLDLDTVLTIAGLEGIKVDPDLVDLVSTIDLKGPHAVNWINTRWANFLMFFWDTLQRPRFSDGEDVTGLVKKLLHIVINAKKLERSGKLKEKVSAYGEEIRKGMDEVKEVEKIRVGDKTVRVGLAVGGDSKAGFEAYYKKADIVVAYNKRTKKITVAARDESFASLIGRKGLLEVAEHFNQVHSPGWGGRATIIGSPRDKDVTESDAEEVYLYIIDKLTSGSEDKEVKVSETAEINVGDDVIRISLVETNNINRVDFPVDSDVCELNL